MPLSWNVVTAPQALPGQFVPTVPATAKVPFHPVSDPVNPARVTETPAFSVKPGLDTEIVPVVPDSDAPVIVIGATVGGFVLAKHDACFKVPPTYTRHDGWWLPRFDCGPVVPLVSA